MILALVVVPCSAGSLEHVVWTGHGARADTVFTLEVAPQKVPCTGLVATQCLRVRFDSSSAWLVFHSEIEGFSFEAGVRWRIEVVRSDVANPPADGSRYRYRLIRVLKRERVIADRWSGRPK